MTNWTLTFLHYITDIGSKLYAWKYRDVTWKCLEQGTEMYFSSSHKEVR